MTLNQHTEATAYAEIVKLTVAAFECQFQSGDRVDADWVTKFLYEYQECPSQGYLVGELKQDIVWQAQKINPNTTSWGITRESYDTAMATVNPRWARLRALDALQLES